MANVAVAAQKINEDRAKIVARTSKVPEVFMQLFQVLPLGGVSRLLGQTIASSWEQEGG
jgi:hypothetical protein